MRCVAEPMSWAVAIASLFTSTLKMASNPANSASRATSCTSRADHPAAGMTASPSRSDLAICPPRLPGYASCQSQKGIDVERDSLQVSQIEQVLELVGVRNSIGSLHV